MRVHVFVVLALFAWSLTPTSAQAFHAAKTFADSPDIGGGGGVFFSGARDEHGWTCAACHVKAERKLQVKFITALFTDFMYTPGQLYDFTLRIDNESKGLDAPRSNYNGFVLRIADKDDSPIGRITHAPADQFYLRANTAGETSIIATQGQMPQETEWHFSWTAPAKGRGDVTFSLGVVDGNAAGQGPASTLTDPFGDDVYTARVTVHERSAKKAWLPIWPGSRFSSEQPRSSPPRSQRKLPLLPVWLICLAITLALVSARTIADRRVARRRGSDRDDPRCSLA